MKANMVKARKAARKLLRENRHGRTWREIAETDFGNKIHFSVLSKFAHADGVYIPGDVQSRILLGIYRKPRRLTPATIYNSEMGQSWTLWMRELVKGMRTETPKELMRSKGSHNAKDKRLNKRKLA